MGVMKRIRTAETSGYDMPPEARAHIRAEKAEQKLRAWQAQSGPPSPPPAAPAVYTVDDAWREVGRIIQDEAAEAAYLAEEREYARASGLPLPRPRRPKRRKQRADGLTQTTLF